MRRNNFNFFSHSVEPLAKLDITTAAVGVCVVEEEAGQEREEPEGGESDKEEDVCPICLNELDEGEDLLVCPGCHNHLHQHCMDVCEWMVVG